MRIGIDARRAYGSGIGRVTSNLIEGLVTNAGDHEFVLFHNQVATDGRRENVQQVFVDMPFFSMDDLYEFPRMIADCGVDLFIAPQFYISPYISCPCIKMVHDLWPVLYPEWIPSEQEFIAKFGLSSWQGVTHFAERFKRLYEDGCVFPTNTFLKQAMDSPSLDVRHTYMIGMMAETLHSATTIVIPSVNTYNEIVATFPESVEKVRFLPNFPSAIFSFNPTTPRENFVLHVSKWERRKNIENVVEAMEIVRGRLGPVQLVLVGDPSYPEYARELTRLILADGRDEWVRHLGVVGDEELADLYRRAGVFLYPSLYEGFGIPLLEAMACGTPTVTSNVCSMPEVAAGAALLVDPGSPSDIARGVVALLTGPHLRNYLQRKGLERLKEFEMTAVVASLLEIVVEATR
jgi:glycosyltransferase involved in cell wall biosynthesis